MSEKTLKQRLSEVKKSLTDVHKAQHHNKNVGKATDTIESLAKEFSDGDSEIETYMVQALQELGKGKSPEELRAMAEELAGKAGLKDEGMNNNMPEEPRDGEDGEDGEVQKALSNNPDPDWRNTVALMREELNIDKCNEVIKSLQAQIETHNKALLELNDILGQYGESVEKSLAQPANREAAIAFLQNRAAQAAMTNIENHHQLVTKSIQKDAAATTDSQRFRGGGAAVANLLAAWDMSTQRGIPLPENIVQEFTEYLGKK